MLRMRCALVLALLLLPFAAQADCHHRRLDKVTDNGRVVQLDDGSEWQISDYDQSEAATWQQDATVTACDDELINTEVHETAQARRTRRGDVVPEAD
jgi:hypothetical protein